MSAKRKPRRWIESIPIKVKSDSEHRDFIEKNGLEAYIEGRYWELSDYDMGQVNHPGRVYIYTQGFLRNIQKLIPQ